LCDCYGITNRYQRLLVGRPHSVLVSGPAPIVLPAVRAFSLVVLSLIGDPARLPLHYKAPPLSFVAAFSRPHEITWGMSLARLSLSLNCDFSLASCRPPSLPLHSPACQMGSLRVPSVVRKNSHKQTLIMPSWTSALGPPNTLSPSIRPDCRVRAFPTLFSGKSPLPFQFWPASSCSQFISPLCPSIKTLFHASVFPLGRSLPSKVTKARATDDLFPPPSSTFFPGIFSLTVPRPRPVLSVPTILLSFLFLSHQCFLPWLFPPGNFLLTTPLISISESFLSSY